jgi:hypothetical protein
MGSGLVPKGPIPSFRVNALGTVFHDQPLYSIYSQFRFVSVSSSLTVHTHCPIYSIFAGHQLLEVCSEFYSNPLDVIVPQNDR